MKVKKSILCSVVLLVLILLLSSVLPATATKKNTANRFNVCFVLDSTDSLKHTDEEKLRYDATNLFLGLLANDGNFVGSVIFSGGIIKKTEIAQINGPKDKSKAESSLETNEQRGTTTIGAALDQAIDLLINKGDSKLPSVVILLSDGQSNKDDKDEMDSRSDALAKAKQESIPVYTVALNADGEADLNVLQQIAEATGGIYEEVKQADDLKEIFKEFYKLIYSAATKNLIDSKIPNKGKISVKFNVPYKGVEEVNIIISTDTKLKELSLRKPSGNIMSEKEVRDITTDAKRVSITKITTPKGGQWTLNGSGKPGSKVKIDMVYNDSITVSTEYKNKEIYGINDKVTVKGFVFEDGKKLKTGYKDYEAKLVPDTKNGTEIPMTTQDNEFVGEISFNYEGTYCYHMVVKGNGLEKTTKKSDIILNVGNRAPVVKNDIEAHFGVFPFFTKTCEVDLSKTVSDPDGDSLDLIVESSTFKKTTYEIKGNKLVIKDFYDLSKGVTTIKATDSKGAFVEFDVTVSLTNVGIIALIVIGVISLIVLAGIVFLIYRLSQKKFMGTITVRNLETGALSTQQKNKGNIKLSVFQVGNTGFAPNARFQASGKSYIFFINSKTVISDSTVRKEKKITIQNRDETRIYSDDSRTRGIAVTFDSYLQG